VNKLLSVGVAVALAATMTSGTGPAQEPATPRVLPADRTYTVTLVTGDVVTVHTRQSGCPSVSGGHSTSCGPDGHVRVIPAAAAGLVGRVLDEDLFDVTMLIQEGYDDASSSEIPLIVRTGELAEGFTQERALPSIGAVAGRQAKSEAAGLVASLDVPAARATGPRVWLDRRVRATQDTTQLDANLRQVRAPQVWDAGHTGAGVRVAVLDTGVDPTHPDLAGKVVEQADFTVDGGDAVDRAGHGTHVAATVAGSGAGSGGARRGVAPDAQLVIGKVLHDDGGGYESDVIAGMEWAAPRATVVNMSLGGRPTDGTDPAAQALETLTRQYGTLFVVGAGNAGPSPGSVGTPATAPSALAVGAVDAQDALTGFSSRGPVTGSHALKPEIVAPGVDIAAARAAGTTMGQPIDAHYTRASGTSMATPHVAGAAAVLAQAHPDWDANKLKAALVGAADPASGGDPYEVGAGRLNLAKAIGTVVSDTGVVNLVGDGVAETKVGWTNTGNQDVELNLDVRVGDRAGESTVDPAVTLAETAVTVPATGSASTVLRVDRAAFQSGFYTAMVTASWPGGSARTPVAFFVEPLTYDLIVTSTTPPDAAPESGVWGMLDVVNIDDPALFSAWELLDPDGTLRLRVPAGRYSVMGVVAEIAAPGQPDEYQARRGAMAGDPDVTVAQDTTVVLDGSSAKPVVATVDGRDTVHTDTAVGFTQQPRRGTAWGQVHFGLASQGRLYASPTDGVGVGSFQGFEGFALDTPDGTTHYDLIRPLPDRIPDDPAYRVTAAEHARLARIDQRFQQPDEARTFSRSGWSNTGLLLVLGRQAPVPPTRVDYVSPDGVWVESGGGVLGEAFVEPSQRYAAGSRQEKSWARQPLRPDWFGGGTSQSPCMPAPVTRTSGLLSVSLVELTDQHDRFTCLGRWPGSEWVDNTKRAMTLYRDGQVVGTHAGASGDFPMARRAATYRLAYDLDAGAVLSMSTKVSTAWTFRSSAPSGTASVPVPLLSVDYAFGQRAEFTVRQAPGTATQKVTGFTAWTSTDDGATWTPMTVCRVARNRFAAELPAVAAGQPVSLRVTATADGGSALEQTIIRAYR
jgi:subtilisin family serine protease